MANVIDKKDEKPVPKTPEVSAADVKADVLAAEKARRDEIRAHIGPLAESNDAVKAVLDKALDDPSIDFAEAAKAAMKASGKGARGEETGPVGGSSHVEVGVTAREKLNQGIVAALESRAGMAKADGGNEFRGHTLLEMAKACLEADGVSIRGLSKLEVAALALPRDARIMASTLTSSTGDFANLMASIATKSMLKGYSEAGETFQQWTTQGSLPDFKVAKRVDLNEFPALSKVDEGGEYSTGFTSDRGESLQLATYGKKFSITRQAIINDDLSAFSRIPQKMGRAAIRTIGNLVYAVLTGNGAMSDGTALFHANHGNLIGATGINTASVASAINKMMLQKDASNNVIALNIPLKYLLVPVALAPDAWTVANSEYEITANKNNTTPNYVRGRFEVITDARLDASSSSIWYGLADSSAFDVIEVSYLDGQTTPFLEQQPGWDVDGIEFKVRIDAGVKALDWRTMVRVG